MGGFFGGGGASVDLASPPAIGNTTPNTGRFTFLRTTGGQGATNGLSFTGSGGDSGKIAFVGYGAQVFWGENSTTNAQCMLGNQIRVRPDGQFSWSNNINNADATGDLLLRRDAAGVLAQYNGTNAQTFRLYNTFTSATNFERVNFRWASNEFILDAEKGSGGGTLRGIKIGSTTTSLLGFYGVTPVDQPATVADPTGGGTQDAEARTAINAIIDRLQELGLVAT